MASEGFQGNAGEFQWSFKWLQLRCQKGFRSTWCFGLRESFMEVQRGFRALRGLQMPQNDSVKRFQSRDFKKFSRQVIYFPNVCSGFQQTDFSRVLGIIYDTARDFVAPQSRQSAPPKPKQAEKASAARVDQESDWEATANG